jgi:hypothetical protein
MPDATAGTNGAVALFLHKRLVDEVLSRLEKMPHLKPMVVGRVQGRGEGKLVVPTLQYISSKKLREKLESPQRVLGGLGKTVERPGRARVYVVGEVQGVGFRPAVRAKAKALTAISPADFAPMSRPMGLLSLFLISSSGTPLLSIDAMRSAALCLLARRPTYLAPALKARYSASSS